MFPTPRWILVIAMALAVLPALGQPEPRVYRDRVEPHWFEGRTSFWYRNDLQGDTKEFVLVDARRGTRQPAFDHARLAAALAKVLGKPVEAARLPVDNIAVDKDATIVISVGGKSWRLDSKSYELKPAPGAEPAGESSLPAEDRPRPSRRTGEETSITIANRTQAEIDLFWLDTEGQRRGYGSIKPGQERQQHTFAGHVWLVSDKSGKVLGVFEATAQAGRAIVDGKTASVLPPSRKPAETQATRRSVRRAESPDGKWTVVVRDNNLFLRARQGGEELPLSGDGKPGDSYDPGQIWWSPDSRKLVAMRTEPAQEHKVNIVESSPRDQLQPRLKTLDYLKPGDRIAHPRPRLFDVISRKPVEVKEDLFANPWSIGDVRWDADSSRFTFIYNQRGHQALRLVAVDAASGEARAIIDEKSETFICYSSKFLCRWIGDREILWMSERDGWNHLWLYDARTGRVKNRVTQGSWVVQSVHHVDEEKRQVWFWAGGARAGQDPYFGHFCRASFDGQVEFLTEGNGTHKVQWNPGDEYFIDTYSRVDLPPVTELRDSRGGKLVCKLEEADAAEALAARGGRWPMPFVARGRDGATEIFGVIFLPRDFDAKAKYPVVEQIYAGPQGFFTPKSFRARHGPQRLADRGMILVQCDGMGTSGRSKKFHDVCFRNLRDAGFPDRIAWMKAAAKEIPQMDLSRVGIYGGSAGGQSAMGALLWHNDFYKVAVADCGCHDNRMDKIWWNEQWMGWPVGKEYAENSNAVNAKLLKGKLLLIVGELDSNVDPASTMQVVGALQKADKDFEHVIIVGANHGAAETTYGSRRRMEFLLKHLGAAGSP